MNFHRMTQIFVALLVLNSCAKNLPGDYPAGREAREAGEISESSFSGASVPCRNKSEISEGLFNLTIQPLVKHSEFEPTLLNYGVDDIKLKDGPGKAAVIQYSLKPGEPGGLAIITIHFYLDKNCRLSAYHRTEGFRKLDF